METVSVEVFTFAELSDSAKEKAREWWRELESLDFNGWGDEFEAAETAAKLLGIEFDRNEVPLHGGGKRSDPNIMYSGFSSQGDGASFTGTYHYLKGSSKAIRQEFGTDNKLWAIADGLTALQRKHGYKLAGRITQSGHYVHKHTMHLDPYRADKNGFEIDSEVDAEVGDELLELMRDFAQWIYDGLESSYDWRMSDESVDDSITANEYRFTVNGDFWGNEA